MTRTAGTKQTMEVFLVRFMHLSQFLPKPWLAVCHLFIADRKNPFSGLFSFLRKIPLNLEN
jgi:hypothetical protein